MVFEGKEAIILALYQLYLKAKPLICKAFRLIQQVLTSKRKINYSKPLSCEERGWGEVYLKFVELTLDKFIAFVNS